MAQFHVVEQFVSINGEGRLAGQLALFIRFAGCNLQCEYCDTKWANEPDTGSSTTISPSWRIIRKAMIPATP